MVGNAALLYVILSALRGTFNFLPQAYQYQAIAFPAISIQILNVKSQKHNYSI